MFLAALRKRRPSGDDGAALITVMAVSVICLLLVALLTSSTVRAFSYTSLSNASVQAQAAAEAGIAQAQAGVNAGRCTGTTEQYKSAPGTTPIFTASVYTLNASNVWVAQCPPTTDLTKVKIRSTGTAQAKGINGASGSDVVTVEGTYTIRSAYASGAALFSYSSDGIGGSGRLLSVDGSSPSVYVLTGDTTCNGAGSGSTDWVVEGGSLTVNCDIGGDTYSTGPTVVSGGSARVGGTVVADGLTVSGSAKVVGSAWSTGAANISGSSSIGGNLTASSLNMASGAVGRDAWISGNATLSQSTVGGTLTSKTVSVTGGSVGTYSTIPAGPGASPYATPIVPIIPAWTDVPYIASDWAGFVPVAMSGNCDYNAFVAKVATLGGAPGLIDARACTNSISISDYQKLSLPNDTAIFANKFSLGGSGGFSSPSAHKLWLINPDNVADSKGICPADNSESFNLGGTFDFSNLSVFIYSPCTISISSSSNFNGQIYGGKTSLSGAGTVGYVQIGIPGFNLWLANRSPASIDWLVDSMRNL